MLLNNHLYSISLFCISLILSLNTFAAHADDAVIYIQNCEQLQGIGTSTGPLNGVYYQTGDIDCSGIDNFRPIGQYDSSSPPVPFTGYYNGQGFTINHLYMQPKQTYGNAALFGYVEDATLENIGIIDHYIVHFGDGNTPDYAGALVGKAVTSTIHNCYAANGYVDVAEVHDGTGGLVGASFSTTITESYVEGGGVIAHNKVGGLIGKDNESHINNSYAATEVFASGTVNGSGGYYAGGLIAETYYSIIEESYATGNVTATNMYAGGLIGMVLFNTTVKQSYALGDVVSRERVGGLIGSAGGVNIENSYAAGDVSGEIYVGGLTGHHDRSFKIVNAYATGLVIGTPDSDSVGGLIGERTSSSFPSEIISSYWDINTSGQTTSQGGEGRTTPQMQLLDNSQPVYVGWDPINIWYFQSGYYPALRESF